jgi:hypothetical protein
MVIFGGQGKSTFLVLKALPNHKSNNVRQISISQNAGKNNAKCLRGSTVQTCDPIREIVRLFPAGLARTISSLQQTLEVDLNVSQPCTNYRLVRGKPNDDPKFANRDCGGTDRLGGNTRLRPPAAANDVPFSTPRIPLFRDTWASRGQVPPYCICPMARPSVGPDRRLRLSPNFQSQTD